MAASFGAAINPCAQFTKPAEHGWGLHDPDHLSVHRYP